MQWKMCKSFIRPPRGKVLRVNLGVLPVCDIDGTDGAKTMTHG